MQKEEYLSSKKRIESEIDSLRQEMILLKSNFMKLNLPIPIGSKVRITISEHTIENWNGTRVIPKQEFIAFIKSYSIDYGDNPVYKFNKPKKNGEESQRELLWLNYDNMIIEEIK